jgi:hypothetical protein
MLQEVTAFTTTMGNDIVLLAAASRPYLSFLSN